MAIPEMSMLSGIFKIKLVAAITTFVLLRTVRILSNSNCAVCQGFVSPCPGGHTGVSFSQGMLLFWEPARSAAYCQGYGVSTFDGAERIGAHTGRNPTTAGKVLYK